MQIPGLKIKQLTAAIGTCLVLGASGPLLADTNLIVEKDGMGLSAFVGSSTQEVLSTSIRIVGPDGFVFEGRIEGATIDWHPPAGLQDGIYTWEAWTVSARRDAQPRDPISSEVRQNLPQDALEARYQQIPIERFFFTDDLDVTTQTGEFQIRGGWIETLDEVSGDELSQSNENNKAWRIAKTLLNLVIPSVQAQNVTASGANPDVRWNRTEDTSDYRLNATNLRLRLQHPDAQPNAWAMSIYRTAPTNTLTVRGTAPTTTGRPRVGIGVSSATEALHIRSTNTANIRLDNPSFSQSWFVKNQNFGKFEISESTSELGAFVIAPDAPTSSLHIRPNQDCQTLPPPFGTVCGSLETRVGINTSVPADNLHITAGSFGGLVLGTRAAGIRLEGSDGGATRIFGSGTQFSIGTTQAGSSNIVRVHGSAPNDSLRVAANGNVGMGTATPEFSLDIRSSSGTGQVRITETNGSNGLTMFAIENSGHPRFRLRNSNLDSNWDFRTAGSGNTEQFQITNISDGQSAFLLRLFKNGNMEIEGDVTANGVLLTSTREAKTDFAPLDVNDVLSRLSTLEISQWRYKHEDEGTVHFGPVAEEFHEIFGLSDGRHLNMIDTNGITFAAIQALHEQNRTLSIENQKLMTRLDRLEAAVNL